MAIAVFAFGAAAHAESRERLSLDQGWLFHRGDISFPVIKGHGASYNNAKAGSAPGAAAQAPVADTDDGDGTVPRR